MPLDEIAMQLNRDAKQPGMCKSSVFVERVRLACIVMGCVGHEVGVELAVIEALNPQAVVEYDDEDDDYNDY